MRPSVRFLAASFSLVLLAACSRAPAAIDLQPLQAQDTINQAQSTEPRQVLSQGANQVMTSAPATSQDLSAILNQAADAAKAGDRAQVITLLTQARQAVTDAQQVQVSAVDRQKLAKHIEQASQQLADAQVNAREVGSILVNQLQEALQAMKAGQGKASGAVSQSGQVVQQGQGQQSAQVSQQQ